MSFSLRTLLLLFLAVSVCLVLFRYDRSAAILLALAVLAIPIGWQRNFWARFGIAMAIMVAINLLPLYLTWEAFGLHGTERTGWPLAFVKRGRATAVLPVSFLTDLAFAIAVSWFMAHLLKDGWMVVIRRLQNWGIEDA